MVRVHQIKQQRQRNKGVARVDMEKARIVAREKYRRIELLKSTNRAYARLRKSVAASRAEMKERVEWDNTLMDGLGDE